MGEKHDQPVSQPDYTPPVSRLLEIGNPLKNPHLEWPDADYLEHYQLSEQHIPELIRMATDQVLYGLDYETSETWAPIHAWRALGRLRAAEAAPALLSLLPRVELEDDEWVLEELPEVYARIGPPAVKPLADYLADPDNLPWACIPAANALEKIGNRYPEALADCVAALVAALENYPRNDPDLNASIALALAELKAVDAAPLVEQAFRSEQVDEMLMGDWQDWQVRAGLLEERLSDRQLAVFPPLMEDRLVGRPASGKKSPSVEKKAKKKAKQARQARKKQRRKK